MFYAKCLRRITAVILVLALFTPFFSLAVSNDTNINLKVVEEEAEEIIPAPAPIPGQRVPEVIPPIIYDIPPANISNFEAIPGDRQIELQWQNPPDPDFKAVKIMRSTEFYPQDPGEGTLVYDGKGTSFVDTGLTNGKRYYYTAFSYDFSGNFSSGAVVSAVPRLKPPLPPEEIFTEKECLESGYYWYDNACHFEPKLVPAPPEVEKITLEDFDFIQEERKILIIDGKIEIKEKESLTIVIDYEKTPEVLKTIMVTLEKDNKFFSFLLRINQEKTAYLATLLPPEDPGIYPLTITILDYKNQALKRITGQLEVFGALPQKKIEIPWYKNWKIWLLILLVLIMLLAIIYFVRKKMKSQKSNLKTTT